MNLPLAQRGDQLFEPCMSRLRGNERRELSLQRSIAGLHGAYADLRIVIAA